MVRILTLSKGLVNLKQIRDLDPKAGPSVLEKEE
jgi:hypothetical protein